MSYIGCSTKVFRISDMTENTAFSVTVLNVSVLFHNQ